MILIWDFKLGELGEPVKASS